MIPKITANGYALFLNALDGMGIQFSKIVVGNGEKPADYRVLSDLQNPILSAEITEITRRDKYVAIRAPMLNSNVEGRLHWTELGVFAKNPSGGEDILYGYAHTDLSGDGQGISVPSYDTNMIELAHIIYVYVGEVDDVTAIIAQSSEYASATELNNHTTNTSNPHNVTAQQVGLGKVPNVTPENQKPVFSETITSVTTADDGTKNLPNILNGDIMGVILQKIRSAISALISHLNAKNPHKLKAHDVGAAASTHYHSASDINKGTLSILRGGTGATSLEEAQTNLGIVPLDKLLNLYIWKKYTGDPRSVKETKMTNAQVAYIFNSGDTVYTSPISYSDSIVINDGELSLVNEQSINYTSTDIDTSVLLGKYINCRGSNMSDNEYKGFHYIPADAKFTPTDSGLWVSSSMKLSVNADVGDFMEIVASKTNDTYPTDGKHTDGYWYVYHKQLGD